MFNQTCTLLSLSFNSTDEEILRFLHRNHNNEHIRIHTGKNRLKPKLWRMCVPCRLPGCHEGDVLMCDITDGRTHGHNTANWDRTSDVVWGHYPRYRSVIELCVFSNINLNMLSFLFYIDHYIKDIITKLLTRRVFLKTSRIFLLNVLITTTCILLGGIHDKPPLFRNTYRYGEQVLSSWQITC